MSLLSPVNASSATQNVTIAPIAQKLMVPGSLRNSYRVLMKDGGEGWLVVTSPDIKGLVTQGKTEEEAARNAVEAAALLLEDVGVQEFNLIVERKY